MLQLQGVIQDTIWCDLVTIVVAPVEVIADSIDAIVANSVEVVLFTVVVAIIVFTVAEVALHK